MVVRLEVVIDVKVLNRTGHGQFFVLFSRFFLFIPMEQKDREIHCNSQLKDCGQSLGDITNLSKEDIGAKIVQDWKDQAQHKQQGNYCALHCHEENQQTGSNGTENI